MIDFSFLDKEQVFGENRLKIFKKYGTEAAITDFSILLGEVSSHGGYGAWWVDGLDDKSGKVLCDAGCETALVRHIGARPSFDASKHFSKFNVLGSPISPHISPVLTILSALPDK